MFGSGAKESLVRHKKGGVMLKITGFEKLQKELKVIRPDVLRHFLDS